MLKLRVACYSTDERCGNCRYFYECAEESNITEHDKPQLYDCDEFKWRDGKVCTLSYTNRRIPRWTKSGKFDASTQRLFDEILKFTTLDDTMFTLCKVDDTQLDTEPVVLLPKRRPDHFGQKTSGMISR